MLQHRNRLFKFGLHSLSFSSQETPVFVLCFNILLLLSVKQRLVFKSCFLSSLCSNFDISTKHSNFLFIFYNYAIELGNLDVSVLNFFVQSILKSICGIHLFLELKLQLMSLFLQISFFSVPLFILSVLSIQPFLVLFLQLFDLCFKLVDFALLESFQFLDSKIEGFNLFIFVLNLFLQYPLLIH